ncbi:MAG: hypothetical protein IJ666_07235 [Ruminococcus sp.]|nr:hypothetical protein [Ruminococcus sp.]
MEKKRKNRIIIFFKTAMLVLTLIYPCMMTILSGAGVYYNRESYGAELGNVGILLVLSGILMTLGAVLCIFRKNIINVISLVFSCSGFALCMTMLYKLCDHADRAGWSDKYTMTPVSDMYKSRIIPCIAPFVMAAAFAVIQLVSYEAAEERRIRKLKKQQKENAPAPKIIDEQ